MEIQYYFKELLFNESYSARNEFSEKRLPNLFYSTLLTFSLIWLFLPFPVSADEICQLWTPSGYQGMDGAEKIGPYSSRAQCEMVNSEYFDNNGTCYCSYTSSAPEPPSSQSPSPDYQQRPSADWDAIHRQQAEEQRRREQEAVKRREREQKAEETRKRQFDQDKQEALKMLKSRSEQNELKGASKSTIKLKGLSSNDLLLKEPQFSKGSKFSAPVDLRSKETDQPPKVQPEDEDIKDALKPLDKKITLDEKVNALYRRGIYCYGYGDLDCAIRFLKEAVRLKPHDRDLRLNLGEVIWTKDKKEDKVKTNPEAELLMDALQYGQGDWDKSFNYLLNYAEELRQKGDEERRKFCLEAFVFLSDPKSEMDKPLKPTPDDSTELLPAVATPPDIAEPEKHTWPGPKNPEKSLPNPLQ